MISDEAIEQAHLKIAAIIVEHGDRYLPIFERLDQELCKRKKKLALLQKAFTMVSEHQKP